MARAYGFGNSRLKQKMSSYRKDKKEAASLASSAPASVASVPDIPDIPDIPHIPDVPEVPEVDELKGIADDVAFNMKWTLMMNKLSCCYGGTEDAKDGFLK